MDRSQSIVLLNRAVSVELQALHQYMYFHFHLDNQRLAPLSSLFKRTAIEEMLHVERLAERILFLKGEVEMAPAGPTEAITEPRAILKKALAMETASQDYYNKAAMACGANADAGTKQVFESMIGDEERHFDQYEKEMEKVEQFGLSYLALQSFSPAGKTGKG